MHENGSVTRHGVIHHAATSDTLILQPIGALNSETISDLQVFLEDFAHSRASEDRPCLEIADLRRWELAPPDGMDLVISFKNRARELGFRHVVYIVEEDTPLVNIYRGYIAAHDLESRFTQNVEEARDTAVDLGYDAGDLPAIFASFRSE